jgi:hypothetical protein
MKDFCTRDQAIINVVPVIFKVSQPANVRKVNNGRDNDKEEDLNWEFFSSGHFIF